MRPLAGYRPHGLVVASDASSSDENRGRLVRFLVGQVVADAAGELHIHLAEPARAMKKAAA
jgi:hypothetical protein